jgi:hypothetical protein
MSLCTLLLTLAVANADSPLTVNKEDQTVTIACKIAPRQLPNLKEVYPIEVIATFPHDGSPKGEKAHETIVTFVGVKPSDVHKALEALGLKPGKPARGEGTQATGPEVKLFLELEGAAGSRRVPVERCLVDRKTGKPLPAIKWHFTGSVDKQVDPNKPEKVYGADRSGTLAALFPVTDETVLQSSLTMKDEPLIKLDTNTTLLPKEGTAVKLVIQVVK